MVLVQYLLLLVYSTDWNVALCQRAFFPLHNSHPVQFFTSNSYCNALAQCTYKSGLRHHQSVLNSAEFTLWTLHVVEWTRVWVSQVRWIRRDWEQAPLRTIASHRTPRGSWRVWGGLGHVRQWYKSSKSEDELQYKRFLLDPTIYTWLDHHYWKNSLWTKMLPQTMTYIGILLGSTVDAPKMVI